MINDAAVQRESNNTITSESPTTPITTMENNNKPGLLSWVQANPLPSLAIASAVGLILYNMSSSKKSSSGLSGYRSKSSGKRRKKRRQVNTIRLR
jgi:hypothetical protein